jgi:hypothetical protein
MQTYAFSDEINFEKFKKVVKNLKEVYRIWTPCNPNFFQDKSKLEVACFFK